MNKLICQTIICCLALTLTGCFTGIENTPKITAGDLRREKIVDSTPERELASAIVYDSPAKWEPGRRFIVTDDRIRLIFSSTPTGSLPHPGDTLIFAGVRGVPSVMGDQATALSFVRDDQSADTLVYRVEVTPREFNDTKSFPIPFMVDLDLVARADSALAGRKVYVTTSYWYDPLFNHYTGRKFVGVTIDSVRAGNTDYPLAVNFTDDRGEQRVMLMTVGDGRSATRNFATLFSLSDPRLRYPSITAENWDAIVNGRVRQYMTRDEVRLALGTPTDVVYGEDHNFSYERWVYPNGAYLIFEDGILKGFRL